MAGVDLSTLGLTGASIILVSLVGGDLGKVTEYSNSIWSSTAWWHAKRINKGLLKYLTENYPFSPKDSYPQEESTADYETNLSRLAGGT
jgi:hypothetical protein